jgi:hypothetical protein
MTLITKPTKNRKGELKTMKKYKYISVYVDDDVETTLNKYAQEGWRLVCPSCVKWWFILEKENSK